MSGPSLGRSSDLPQALPEAMAAQHGHIAAMVTGLRRAHTAGEPWSALASYVDRLLGDVRKHFATEEAAMEAARYASLDGHRDEHEVFLRRLEIVRIECDRRETELMPLLTEMLDNWFRHHEDTWDRDAMAVLKPG
jgi:hemerythrin-like metal-binding protein